MRRGFKKSRITTKKVKNPPTLQALDGNSIEGHQQKLERSLCYIIIAENLTSFKRELKGATFMFKANYAKVNEETARRAKEMNSFSNYTSGTATAEHNIMVDKLAEYANTLWAEYPTSDNEKIEKVQYYIDKYSIELAKAIDEKNAIDCRCPSIMICGGGNFPVHKKEKQNAARDNHYNKYKDLYKIDHNNYYREKIRLTMTDSGIIKSDDPKAAAKIKDKIAKLENENGPYGNKKAEIRRLKERLLVLSPDDVKAGKKITINGKTATYENIIALFNSFKPVKLDEKYYLNIPLLFSDGKRKYKGYISREIDESGENISTYGNAENDYQTIWKPLTNDFKFLLVIAEIKGSGNKAVIYSILKDLMPKKQDTPSDMDKNYQINGESVTVKENKEIMRLQISFDGIPLKETREIMKSNGFKWAPSQKAWQRLLNENAKYALSKIAQ